jgi:hypothetical protein
VREPARQARRKEAEGHSTSGHAHEKTSAGDGKYA